MTDGEAAFLAAHPVSRETLDRLHLYAALLRKWTPRINLISKGALDELWHRHMRDSAQLMALAPESARTWCDLGSGGGFPGLVVAILARDVRPGLSVTLIEADKRKAAFLRTVNRDVGMDVQVLDERVEAAPPQGADVLSARALAPLPKLLGLARRHLAPDGTALFPKGAQHASEHREALELWRFRCETRSSETDPDAVILSISELSRA